MKGFFGRAITIDMGQRRYTIEHLSNALLERYLGGKGLATHLLLQKNPVGVDPLSPENHLIIATGPFCQSPLHGGSRFGVYTKSPLTGFYAESYSGGKVPESIDATGFDAVLFVGRAEHPAAVRVHPDGADFFDAGDLWGQDCYTSEKLALEKLRLKKEGFRKPGAIVIGPADENLVRFSLIANDKWRCAGRAGVGAVMGSKNLKAVVFQGDRKRDLHRPDEVKRYSKAFLQAHKNSPGAETYRNNGTPVMVALMNSVGAFPAKYWQQGSCEHWERISADTFHKEHEVKPHACAKCFMACGRMTTLSKGRHKGLTLEGPEYETIYAFGGLCMVQEIDEIVYLNDLCDRWGIDTITTGNLCGLTIEAAARGKIDYDIAYGEVDKIAELIHKIAKREGIGETLSKGIRAVSEAWGVEDIAIHVKGMEPAGYDPRVLKGMGLTFATSPRGACHLRTTFYKPELAGMIPPDQIENKAEMLIDFEDRINIFDTMVLCRFYRDLYTWEELEKTIELVTGLPMSRERMRTIASEIVEMTRQFNLREGLRTVDDRLPKRLCTEALPSGNAITEEEMQHLLADYYNLRGWSRQETPTGN